MSPDQLLPDELTVSESPIEASGSVWRRGLARSTSVDSRFHEPVREATGDEQRFVRDGEPVRPSPVCGTTTSGRQS
jgi:hypothetical protein